MSKDKYLMYGLAAVAAVGIDVDGVPAYHLLLPACPVMMFFMMASVSGDSAPQRRRESPRGTRRAHRGADRWRAS